MEIKIVEYEGTKSIQVLNIEDTQGVAIEAQHYPMIKELARELGWEPELKCNFKIGRKKAMFMSDPKKEDFKEISHYDCALTQGIGVMLCNEELCPHQQQLKLLKEIKQAMWPLYQELKEK